MKWYARTKLLARFRQDAIYLRWLVLDIDLVRPADQVTRGEEEEE